MSTAQHLAWADNVGSGYIVINDVKIRMRDGVRLSANLYLPKNSPGALGTVLIRLPYNKDKYSRALVAASLFADNGFAVLVQDMRGRHGSEGVFAPYRHMIEDGVDTLEWVAGQSWSNGRIGTFGCSALGESQHILAKIENPRHVAMITQGAGGAMGSAAGRFSYFGIFEGGVLNLASAVGWFATQGQKTPGKQRRPTKLNGTALLSKPVIELVANQHVDKTDFEEFLTHPFGDPWWDELGYLKDGDGSTIPTLAMNTWEDQTVADTLAIAELSKQAGIERGLKVHHPVIIGPGNHCEISTSDEDFQIGELLISNAYQPYNDWYLTWFRYWLITEQAALPDLPNYLLFVLGENRWMNSEYWPPRNAKQQKWVLTSNVGANGVGGDGKLLRLPQSVGSKKEFDKFRYDPDDPVPTRGGPVCCTGNPNDRPGHIRQADVERRKDVLVYTSDLLEKGLRVVGPLEVELLVSSSAKDTDITAKLTDVFPDGTSLNIQEGALRMRYRSGFTSPELMTQSETYPVVVDMRAIAYYLAPGHRMRLQISSSNFPRLERNLNTGGANVHETEAVIAENKIWLLGKSHLDVYVIEDTE